MGVGATHPGMGNYYFGPLSLPFVPKALPPWNPARRKKKFPDREICRLQGPWGGKGWPQAPSSCSWNEGLGFSELDWGKAACLPGREGVRAPQQSGVLTASCREPGGPM